MCPSLESQLHGDLPEQERGQGAGSGNAFLPCNQLLDCIWNTAFRFRLYLAEGHKGGKRAGKYERTWFVGP